VNNSRIVKLIN